jgi:hypothetical protein
MFVSAPVVAGLRLCPRPRFRRPTSLEPCRVTWFGAGSPCSSMHQVTDQVTNDPSHQVTQYHRLLARSAKAVNRAARGTNWRTVPWSAKRSTDDQIPASHDVSSAAQSATIQAAL